MTVVNKDADQWRRSVDRKLNTLQANYVGLSDRLDQYSKDMAKNTDLTKGIDKKIDDLIDATATAVDFAKRAKWTSTIVRVFWKLSHQMIVWVGQAGVFMVTILAAYYVVRGAGSWGKAFVNIFNGNLN
jgi:hypothetical protein